MVMILEMVVRVPMTNGGVLMVVMWQRETKKKYDIDGIIASIPR